jgi:hypothetical protein
MSVWKRRVGLLRVCLCSAPSARGIRNVTVSGRWSGVTGDSPQVWNKRVRAGVGRRAVRPQYNQTDDRGDQKLLERCIPPCVGWKSGADSPWAAFWGSTTDVLRAEQGWKQPAEVEQVPQPGPGAPSHVYLLHVF